MQNVAEDHHGKVVKDHIQAEIAILGYCSDIPIQRNSSYFACPANFREYYYINVYKNRNLVG